MCITSPNPLWRSMVYRRMKTAAFHRGRIVHNPLLNVYPLFQGYFNQFKLNPLELPRDKIKVRQTLL